MKLRPPDSRVNIRPASLTDLPSIIALERQSAAAAHWSEEQYRAAFRADSGRRLVMVAEASEVVASGLAVSDPAASSKASHAVAPGAMSHNGLTTILGFLIAQQISPDWELENIVVAREFRRRGIGRQLLNALFAAASETDRNSGRKIKTGCVFLEIRESNSAARTLYESAGFEIAGRRKSYYSNPLEDAILHRCPIS